MPPSLPPSKSVSRPRIFVVALVVQVVAQALSGVWGAAIGGILTGFLAHKNDSLGIGFSIGFFSAMAAAALLLLVVAFKGASLFHWAGMVAANFGLPSWGLFALTLLLPAIQAGGLAGSIRLFTGNDKQQ